MIFSAFSRALGLAIKPAHLSNTGSLQHGGGGPRHTIDAILGLGSRTSPSAQDHCTRTEHESSGESPERK